MGMRRIGSKLRATQKARSRKRNAPRKARERRVRDAKMLEIVKTSNLPYTPWVMSWLCDKLEMKSTRITQDDVSKVVARLQPAGAA